MIFCKNGFAKSHKSWEIYRKIFGPKRISLLFYFELSQFALKMARNTYNMENDEIIGVKYLNSLGNIIKSQIC